MRTCEFRNNFASVPAVDRLLRVAGVVRQEITCLSRPTKLRQVTGCIWAFSSASCMSLAQTARVLPSRLLRMVLLSLLLVNEGGNNHEKGTLINEGFHVSSVEVFHRGFA